MRFTELVDVRKLIPFLCLFIQSCTTMTAQTTSFKAEFIETWSNSMEYTLKVAKLMPDHKYSYRPSEDVRTFGEQMEHIAMAITYHSKSAIDVKHTKFKGNISNKEEVISYLESQYLAVKNVLKSIDETDFEETVSFWAGRMTRGKILTFTNNHVTHHRAQAILYLRMNDIKPPDYIGW